MKRFIILHGAGKGPDRRKLYSTVRTVTDIFSLVIIGKEK